MKSDFLEYCKFNGIKVRVIIHTKGEDAYIQTGEIISYDKIGIHVRTMKNDDCYYPLANIIEIKMIGFVSDKEKLDIARLYPKEYKE